MSDISIGVIKDGTKQIIEGAGVTDMTGATSQSAGTHGLVPAPQAGDEDKVLRGDGTWGSAGDTASVRYYNGKIQYTPDGGTTWVDLINVNPSVQLLPLMTSNSHPLGVVTADTGYGTGNTAYKAVDGSSSEFIAFSSENNYLTFTFTDATYVNQLRVKCKVDSSYAGQTVTFRLDYSVDGMAWTNGVERSITSAEGTMTFAQDVGLIVKAIRFIKTTNTARADINGFEAWG